LPDLSQVDGELSSEGRTVYDEDDEGASEVLLDEVRRAESKFPLGYVGVNFFVTRWQASQLDP
jgi:hypothetical protein